MSSIREHMVANAAELAGKPVRKVTEEDIDKSITSSRPGNKNSGGKNGNSHKSQQAPATAKMSMSKSNFGLPSINFGSKAVAIDQQIEGEREAAVAQFVANLFGEVDSIRAQRRLIQTSRASFAKGTIEEGTLDFKEEEYAVELERFKREFLEPITNCQEPAMRRYLVISMAGELVRTCPQTIEDLDWTAKAMTKLRFLNVKDKGLGMRLGSGSVSLTPEFCQNEKAVKVINGFTAIDLSMRHNHWQAIEARDAKIKNFVASLTLDQILDLNGPVGIGILTDPGHSFVGRNQEKVNIDGGLVAVEVARVGGDTFLKILHVSGGSRNIGDEIVQEEVLVSLKDARNKNFKNNDRLGNAALSLIERSIFETKRLADRAKAREASLAKAEQDKVARIEAFNRQVVEDRQTLSEGTATDQQFFGDKVVDQLYLLNPLSKFVDRSGKVVAWHPMAQVKRAANGNIELVNYPARLKEFFDYRYEDGRGNLEKLLKRAERNFLESQTPATATATPETTDSKAEQETVPAEEFQTAMVMTDGMNEAVEVLTATVEPEVKPKRASRSKKSSSKTAKVE